MGYFIYVDLYTRILAIIRLLFLLTELINFNKGEDSRFANKYVKRDRVGQLDHEVKNA